MSLNIHRSASADNSAPASVRPEPPAVAHFTDLVHALELGDLRAASEARRRLHETGWFIRPPSRWGKGGDE